MIHRPKADSKHNLTQVPSVEQGQHGKLEHPVHSSTPESKTLGTERGKHWRLPSIQKQVAKDEISIARAEDEPRYGR